MKNTQNNIWLPVAIIGGISLTLAMWSFSKKRAKRRLAEKKEADSKKEDAFFEEVDFEDNYLDLNQPLGAIKEIDLPAHLTRNPREVLRPVSEIDRLPKEKSAALDNVAAVGKQLTKRRYKKTVKPRYDILRFNKYYRYLQKEFEVLQLGVQNNTDKERTVVLWGANEEPPVSPNTREDVIDKATKRSFTKFTTEVGVHPQGIVVNPFNNLIYVANQLSDSVSVLDNNGDLLDTITLKPNAINGHNSPAALAVHTQTNVTNYGKVYVAGSVSNTVSVIDAANTIVSEILVGKRPVACTFHPITSDLWVVNLLDSTVSVIDTESESVISTLPTGLNPKGITIDEQTGNVYIMNSGDNTVSVFSQDLVEIRTINVSGIASELVSGNIHPDTRILYVVDTKGNQLIPIRLEDNSTLDPIAVGNSPYGIVLHTENNFMYVGNRNDNTLSVIDGDGTSLGTIQREQVNIGLTYDPSTGAILTSDTAGHRVTGIGFLDRPAITIDGDYMEKREEFKYANAYIKHVKFILSGEERFKVLSMLYESVTGKVEEKPVPFSAYNMPQNFQNISEVFELENTILDGKHRWKFKIAARQKITILIYYYQLDEETKHQKTIR